MKDLYSRALDILQDLVDYAAPQSGPMAADRDVEHDVLVRVCTAAEILLYEAGRRLP